MGFSKKDKASEGQETTYHEGSNGTLPQNQEQDFVQPTATFKAIALGLCASMGGMVFGYESGQISGFQNESDFQRRFGQNGAFSAARSGTIVGLLSIGALLGCLTSAPLQDKWGRKYMVCACALLYIVGVIIEITSTTHWVQFAIGRLVTGLGVGALSTAVPTYQQECVPKNIRSPIVASYQLFITFGILLSYLVNFATDSTYSNSAQWRITVGISAVWALILGGGILCMPESPRWLYKFRETDGDHSRSAAIIASLAGVPVNSHLVVAELAEIEEKAQEERDALAAHPAKFSDIFTGPGMLHRVLLGCVLQAGQQLTGANYFFYYGTTIFKSSGISNSFITSIILGAVNFGATFAGLWIVKKFGARRSLMVGAAWMMVCFFIFAFVGHEKLIVNPGSSTKTAGTVLIVFTCLFICAFATTWGPMVWSSVSELYPIQHRARCLALATACNWGFNFLMSFFTTFITNKIDYYYGLVFAVCCGGLFFVVYFFMVETKGLSLDQVDTLYSDTSRGPVGKAFGSTGRARIIAAGGPVHVHDSKTAHSSATHVDGGVKTSVEV